MTRDEILKRLPFYANGSLPSEERDQLDHALAQDESMRAELALVEALRDHLRAEPVNSPGEIGLARLLDRLDQSTPANLTRSPRLWQFAAAVLLGVVVLQGVLLVSPLQDGGPYRLAEQAEPVLTASFRPDVTEAQLRAALVSSGLVIVDGPSALGLYGLAPVAETDLGAARAALLASGVTEDLQ